MEKKKDQNLKNLKKMIFFKKNEKKTRKFLLGFKE